MSAGHGHRLDGDEARRLLVEHPRSFQRSDDVLDRPFADDQFGKTVEPKASWSLGSPKTSMSLPRSTAKKPLSIICYITSTNEIPKAKSP